MQKIFQKRAPNWIFRTGLLVRSSSLQETPVYSGLLPDFIGCTSFGHPGIRESKVVIWRLFLLMYRERTCVSSIS